MQDGDVIQIIVDRNELKGSVNLIGHGDTSFSPEEALAELENRSTHPELAPDPDLPDDTKLWAALQRVGGGTWGGCVYDVDRIVEAIKAGEAIIDSQE